MILKMPAPTQQHLRKIHTGLLHHYRGDRWFHVSELFNQKIKQATDSFLQAGLNRERLRLSVIAHVAVEMLIDRQLVMQQPEICREFYEQVDAAPEKAIEQYFDMLGQPLAKQHFLNSFKFFKQKRFLLLFTELENVLFGVNKVYSQVTKTEFTEEEKQKMLAGLHNIDKDMRYSWQKILNHKL